MSKPITAAEPKTVRIQRLQRILKETSDAIDTKRKGSNKPLPMTDPLLVKLNKTRTEIRKLQGGIKANTVDGSEEKQAAIRELIAIFLQLNPEPADEQVHSLAAALAVDKESLESVFYEMLGEAVEGEESQVESFPIGASTRMKVIAGIAEVSEDGGQGDVGLSLSQKVREGDYDESTVPVDDLMINDGELAMEDPDTGFQEELSEDGYVDNDMDLGNAVTMQDVTVNDGAPDLEI